MNDHLIPLARGAGIEPVVERGLGDEAERVRVLLLIVGASRDPSTYDVSEGASTAPVARRR